MNFFSRPKNKDDTDDDKLLNSYRESGELAVLGRLYEKQMPLVYGVCLKYLKDPEQARDAVMEIFEELITKAKRHDIKQFRSRNHCLMELRAGKKIETVNVDEFVEFTPFLHHEDEDKETVMRSLEECMEQLTENQKKAIQLFYLSEKCYKEIADTTGFSLNEVKSYIQNGKRNLKICMERNSE
jgi:RNA polymerase sigma factor (sigma-70 family)